MKSIDLQICLRKDHVEKLKTEKSVIINIFLLIILCNFDFLLDHFLET